MIKRRLKIRDDMFDTTIHVFLNWPYPAMKAVIDREVKAEGKTIEWDEDDIEYYKGCEGAYLHQELSDGSVKRIIWICTFDRNDLGMVTVSHECMHAALEVLQEREVGYSKDSEEAFVRYHDFLFTKILASV